MESVPRLSPAAVVCLALLIVVLVNGGMILALRRGGSHRQVDLLRRAVGAARNPFAEQEKTIDELHDRVKKLGAEEGSPSEPDE